MNRGAAYVVPLLLLTGCVSQPYIPPASSLHYEQELAAYTGKNVRDLVPQWGPPASTVVTEEGQKTLSWPNALRWGCTTIGVVDSSGTVLSLTYKGDDCLAYYSDTEIKNVRNKFKALLTLAPRLKRKAHLKLTFYEGAVDVSSRPPPLELDCYFVHYSRLFQELSVLKTKEPQSRWYHKDIDTFELQYVKDITILPD